MGEGTASHGTGKTSCLRSGTLGAEPERRFLLGGRLGEHFLEKGSERSIRKRKD